MAIHPNNTFPTKTNAPDANYPLGSARDVTTPGDGTGTPWIQDIVNDIFGWQQELLDKSGISVIGAGTPDRVGASDYYNAGRLTSGYPGTIVPLAINADPATLGLRVLILDGSGVLVTAYGDLTDNCYVGDSLNGLAASFYRATDAAGTTRSTTGSYLILPDCRGRVLRGLDPTGTRDPDGAIRNVADYQSDAVQKHNHMVTLQAIPNWFDTSPVSTGLDKDVARLQSTKSNANVEASAVDIGEEISGVAASVVPTGRVDVETRSKNMSVNWGVWY